MTCALISSVLDGTMNRLALSVNQSFFKVSISSFITGRMSKSIMERM